MGGPIGVGPQVAGPGSDFPEEPAVGSEPARDPTAPMLALARRHPKTETVSLVLDVTVSIVMSTIAAHA